MFLAMPFYGLEANSYDTIDDRRLWSLALQLACALTAAHSQKICIADLKPEHLCISQGVMTLVDLGSAHPFAARVDAPRMLSEPYASFAARHCAATRDGAVRGADALPSVGPGLSVAAANARHYTSWDLGCMALSLYSLAAPRHDALPESPSALLAHLDQVSPAAAAVIQLTLKSSCASQVAVHLVSAEGFTAASSEVTWLKQHRNALIHDVVGTILPQHLSALIGTYCGITCSSVMKLPKYPRLHGHSGLSVRDDLGSARTRPGGAVQRVAAATTAATLPAQAETKVQHDRLLRADVDRFRFEMEQKGADAARATKASE